MVGLLLFKKDSKTQIQKSMSLSAVQKLDTVLQSLSVESFIDKDELNLYKSLEQILVDLVIVDRSSTLNDVVMILHKLIKVGYVNRVLKEDDFPLCKEKIYYLTYDGKLCLLEGGYTSLISEKRRQKKKQNYKDLMLIVGSWLAGIGAIALTIWEIYKHYNLHID